MKAETPRLCIDYKSQSHFQDDTGPYMLAADVERVVRRLEWEARNYRALLQYVASTGAVLDDTLRNHIRGVLKFEPVENLGAAANVLIARAEALGLVLRIETEPLDPPAMGHYKMVASVQTKREPR